MRAHALEHSLEVQLPFLQARARDFQLVPFAVGDATARRGRAKCIDLLWGGDGDADRRELGPVALSRYARRAQARSRDRATRSSRCRPTLDHEQACGATPVNGLLVAARRRGLAAGAARPAQFGRHGGRRARVVG